MLIWMRTAPNSAAGSSKKTYSTFKLLGVFAGAEYYFSYFASGILKQWILQASSVFGMYESQESLYFSLTFHA